MKTTQKYVIGLDFGTDSCRALVVDVCNGQERGTGVSYYPRWKEGKYCDPHANRYRQHPLDYIESMTEAVHIALSQLTDDEANAICGLCFDTTGSTPALTDSEGNPLALCPEFADDPDAMFVLWKDHTAVREAEQINDLVKARQLNYLMYEGGTYSSEWVWSKVLHILNTNDKIKKAAYSWVEHCDWMTALVTGNTRPEQMLRSRCAAGHKAMWHADWGLPSAEFLTELNPALAAMRPHLFTETYTAGTKAGTLTREWAERLGLPMGIAVSVGAIDAHMGAVGASIAPGVLTRIMGTSTCDILVASKEEIGNRCIPGICGQVDGSVLPDYIGFEAGQSAFGDIYAWFKNTLAWPLQFLPDSEEKRKVKDDMLVLLTNAAQAVDCSETSAVALDWLNGRRTPDADQSVKGMIANLTLGTTAPELFRAWVEATAFGSRRIAEHMKAQGLRIESVNAIGGISKKAPFVMQTLADVMGMPIRVIRTEQTCALGACMFAAVAAGVYPNISQAIEAMGSDIEAEYQPNPQRKQIYDVLYTRYLKLAETANEIR